MAGTVYLADTSVYVLRARHAGVKRRFDDLMLSGRLAACQMVALEYLNNAPDPKAYETLWDALHSQRWMDVTRTAMDRAMDVHRELAAYSRHRNFRLPDLVIAATAEENGAVVLHYDADYDRIAEVTGQPVEWAAPKGSI
ncbi:PIN domain nuclease [Nocardiopsis baichengensis]|uniref:PIN domain nuclease n=1 Tax=Nocardiopsis baichengensis TaxID=280240 RepID=UPI001EFA02DD|nr:PIN domain nuclease [Nocardiopsis baichengensis]